MSNSKFAHLSTPIYIAGSLAASLIVGGCTVAENRDEMQASTDAPHEMENEWSQTTEKIGSSTSEIVSGANTITDTDVDPRWPEVVTVGGCTGTLVSPVHVLTAGHCNIAVGNQVRLDTPRLGSGGSGRRGYFVVKTNPLSRITGDGADLDLLLLDQAVPTFGAPGFPEYSVVPATAFSTTNPNAFPAHTVGYGNNVDCAPKSGFGTRRGLLYNGGFRRYAGLPGVLTRQNLPCDAVNKGPSTGDSGGPLLDTFGRVVGVFSGWSCRNTAGARAPGCARTIEWTGFSAANAAWLSGAMAGDFDGDGQPDLEDPRPNLNCIGNPGIDCDVLRPDFEVLNIEGAGCTGSGGDPVVAITVRNNGPTASSAWVDVFANLSEAPAVGRLSATHRFSDVLETRETQTLYFGMPLAIGRRWIDVIVDSPNHRIELDETNNVKSARVTIGDCSFN